MIMKRNIKVILALAAVVFMSMLAVFPVQAGRKVKPTSIKAVGSKSVTVSKGKKFELEVRMNPRKAEDDYLTWSIVSGKGVVRFEDDDLHDDEVDLWAVKTGTAKVRCKIRGTKKSVTFTVKVKKSSVKTTIKAVGSKSRSVKAGQEFELKVRTSSNIDDDDLKWTIVSGKKVVRFDDDDIYDDEMELVALKAGTAKVRCTIRGTKKSVTFKITVKKAAASTITRVGPEERVIYLGQEFELEVYRRNVHESYLRWKIADQSIVIFEDGYADHDDEIDLIAVGVGTTTVTCTNTLTGKSVSFTIRVVG
jgi:hypothetical protein